MMDHVDARDPSATETIERFFDRFSVPMDLRVGVLSFRNSERPVATLVMPTVHPGPFASLGASDLPRKLSDRLAGSAGVVLVPHTPCNHDEDLPTARETGRVADAAERCLLDLSGPAISRGSPLVSPRAGSFARAQVVGDTALVVVSQAPEPTDDIDFAIADQVYQSLRNEGAARIALLDAHNSYREGEGDLSYGAPRARQLVDDAHAAVAAALAASRDGPLRVGVNVHDGYDIGLHGIGPEGIRCLVIEAAGHRTAYVLIDGNNLLEGIRAQILDALKEVVDNAEVLTTDNHVVHEVDGGVNPVGERYPAASLVRDVRAGVEHALTQMNPVTVWSGEQPIPAVRVLQPAWTIRLMTALSDTFVVFTSALLSTFLLLVMAAVVVLLLLT
jgi:putative membrane protein